MDHKEIMTLVIAYTCVGIFVATAIITVLSLGGFLRVEEKVRNRLYSIILLEVGGIAIGVFSNFLTLSPQQLANKIDTQDIINQTLKAILARTPSCPQPQESINPTSRVTLARPTSTPQANPAMPTPSSTQADLKPHVYFHIRDESQRTQAVDLARKLADRSNVIVPGVQRLDEGPLATELRYFRSAEEPEAKKITEDLSAIGLKVSKTYVPGFESSNRVNPRSYELWIASGSRLSF